MLRITLTLLLSILFSTLPAQSYKKLWQQVEKAQKNDLPREAILAVTKVEEKATVQKDAHQEMMALFVKMHLRSQLSPDSFQVDRAQLAQRIQQFSDSAERTLWSAILARVVATSSFVHSDERNKHTQQLLTLLANMELLHTVKATVLSPLVCTGKDAEEFDTDMLHLLLFDCLDNARLSPEQQSALCQQAETFYRSKKLIAGAIRFALRYKDAETIVEQYVDYSENAIAYATWVEEEYSKTNLDDNASRQSIIVLANEGIQKYGRHQDAKRIKAVIRKLENPTVRLQGCTSLCYPNHPMPLAISVINHERATFQLYRCNADGTRLISRIATLKVDFPEAEAWQRLTDTLTLTLPEPGTYKLVLQGSGKEEVFTLLSCSRITPFIFRPNSGVSRIMALDSRRGTTIPKFSVLKYGDNKELLHQWQAEGGTFWMDAQTMSSTPHEWGRFQLVVSGDSCSNSFYNNVSPYRYNINKQRNEQRVQLFTDRAIYRPGQRVHVAGLLYTQTHDALHADTDVDLQVELILRGDKKVASFTTKTDKFGQFTGDFQLPNDLQDGNLSVRVQHPDAPIDAPKIPAEGCTSITIAAYKRQTFSITFLPITAVYTWSDTLQVQGKVQTTTQQPLANALVRYTINENTYMRRTAHAPIEGIVRTDAEGLFTIPLVLKKATDKTAAVRIFYPNYSITVAAISDNGETQTAQLNVPVFSSATALNLNLSNIIVKEQLPLLSPRSTNNAGTEINEQATLSLYNDSNTLVWSQQCATNASLLPSEWAELNDGTYKLVVKTPSGAQLTHKFLLISARSHTAPHSAPQFFFTEAFGESTSDKWLLVGTTLKGIALYKDVVSQKGEIIHSEVITLSEEVRRLSLTYDTIYGEGATVHLMALAEGKFYEQTIRLERPQPDLCLKMSWQTFRNRLTPGQTEEWTLSITHPDGTPASAALIARLYDASLDALAYNGWNANLFKEPHFTASYGLVYHQNSASLHFAKKYKEKVLLPAQFASWNPQFTALGSGQTSSVLSEVSLRGLGSKDMAKNVLYESTVQMKTAGTADAETANKSHTPIALRENFSEVAFMQAALHSDADGVATIRFNLPDQLTSWKFTAFAHDTLLRHALQEETIVAQKAVTVSANVPRFVREGDALTIPIVVRSMLADSVRGRFIGTFFDVDTRAELSHTVGSFTVEQGSATFNLCAPLLDAKNLLEKGLSVPRAIGCRVEIEGTDFADGEVHEIPVLSDRVEVVRSLPFTLTEGGAHTYSLDTLWTDTLALRAPQVTLTLTPSALSEAVRALTALALEPTRSIDDWARRYYALSMTLHLHEQGITVADFDTAKVALLRSEAVLHIRQRQFDNGAWAWFEGMRENTFITSQMLLLLARVEAFCPNHPLCEETHKALRYMHQQMEKLHTEMTAEEQRTKHSLPLGELPLRYLDACTYLHADSTKASAYFLTKVEALNPAYTLYGKAVMSRVLRQGGKVDAANKLLQSLREYLVATSEMGAYFDAPKAQVTHQSYRIPTQTAAIEAFHAAGDTATVALMQQWLLQSKRTQQWNTTSATADAVFALCVGKDYTVKKPLPQLNTTSCDTTFAGIIRTLCFTQSDAAQGVHLNAEQQHIDVNCPPTANAGYKDLAYGSVRAQYSLPLSMVQTYDSGLGVTLRFETKQQGKWQHTDGTTIDCTLPLRQVVTVTATRDFDFVHLSVPRPACSEPAKRLNGYIWAERIGAYRIVTDTGAELYMDKMPKGTYTFTEELHTDRTGSYQQGNTTITCTYAPEFAGSTGAQTVEVERE